jgi:bacillithiol biosynthesis deacetylase BshB1
MVDHGYLCDALFFGAHPDDVEMLAGGLIARLTSTGRRVVIADATRGEMGTRGTPEIRAAEAAEGARLLGAERVNMALPDGGIGHDPAASARAVVEAIRTHRPRLVFTHSGTDHHPDHNALHVAVRQAFFLANVGGYITPQPRHRPNRLFYFWSHRQELPPNLAFVADISPFWEQKIAAVRAYGSQFDPNTPAGPATYLTSDLFWHRFEARFAYFGSLVNVRYGEPYLADGVLRLDDPLTLPDVTE